MPTPHVLVMPLMVPPPFISQAYPPVGGPPVQPYALAPPQHPFAGYPPTQWPQYRPYYLASQGLYEGDSETAKPEKFMGCEPSQLHPFIISRIMAFDSRPRKFATEGQQVT